MRYLKKHLANLENASSTTIVCLKMEVAWTIYKTIDTLCLYIECKLIEEFKL